MQKEKLIYYEELKTSKQQVIQVNKYLFFIVTFLIMILLNNTQTYAASAWQNVTSGWTSGGCWIQVYNSRSGLYSAGVNNSNWQAAVVMDALVGDTLTITLRGYNGYWVNGAKQEEWTALVNRTYTYNVTSAGTIVFGASDSNSVDNNLTVTVTMINPDTTPPTVGTFQDAKVRYINTADGGTFRVHVSGATDDISGVAGLYLWVSTNGGASWNILEQQKMNYWNDAGSGWYDVTIAGEGTYTMRVHTVDNAGNWNWSQAAVNAGSENEFVIVDRTAPTHGYWCNSEGTNINWTTSYSNLASGGTIRVYAMGAADSLSGIEGMYVWISNNGAESWNILTQQKMTETTINGSRAWYYDIPITTEGTYILHTCPKDNAGNWVWSGPEQFIVVDRTVPQITSFTPLNIATNQDSITVTAEATDALAGMSYMRFYAWYGDGEVYRTSIDLTSTDGTYQTTFKFSEIVDGATNQMLGNNGTYNIHIYAYDKAGNYSVQSTTAIYDTFAPTNGSVKINNDNEFTNVLEVTLTLYAEDETSGVAQVAISNTETVGTYEEYVTTKTWNLGTNGGNTEEGLKTVYVVYKDAAGNTTVIL